MKYSQWIGLAAVLVLIGSCFMPWTYYPDIQKNFTGFFSEGNNYGKPGKVFIVLGVVAALFYLIPKIWAKRWNLLVTALTTAFAIKSFILFSGCYSVYCPERKAGIWLMLGASFVMLGMALLPSVSIPEKKNQ